MPRTSPSGRISNTIPPGMTERLWQPGDVVVLRNVRSGWVPWIAPMRVVQDTGNFVALFLDIGTSYRRLGGPDGHPNRDYINASSSVESTWTAHRALHLIRAGDSHSTVAMWDESGNFVCWYINFQQPIRRTPLGFDTLDLTLDLVIEPNLTDWHWKDEGEFERGIEAGLYTPSDLDRLKGYGLAIVEDARLGASPFADSWEHWGPDPTWAIPTLSPGWDIV